MDQMLAMQNGDSEDEGESDDEDEEGESDEDEDEDESEELGGFQPRGRKEPSVIIEDVTDKEVRRPVLMLLQQRSERGTGDRPQLLM